MKYYCLENKEKIRDVVDVHLRTFQGFFLTFLGRGFLKLFYSGFVEREGSGIIVAENANKEVIGFLAYSDDISEFYKYLIKKKLFGFAWYAGIAFLKKPQIMFRLLRAFMYPKESRRTKKYIELSSIGVLANSANAGVGSCLIDKLKNIAQRNQLLSYIKLETDAVDNEKANAFYKKNGFYLNNEYTTPEGRRMNEYRFYLG